MSIYHRLLPGGQNKPGLHHKQSVLTTHTTESHSPSRSETPVPRVHEPLSAASDASQALLQPTVPSALAQPTGARRISYANPPAVNGPSFTPILESVDHAIKDTGIQPLQLSGSITTDDFTRAVAVATVSALRHQQHRSPARLRTSGAEMDAGHGGHGGHDGPSWSRATSASVLLACTALYAIIAGTCFRVVILRGMC